VNPLLSNLVAARRPARRRAVAVAILVLSALAVALPGVAVGGSGSPVGDTTSTVTLITGDQVMVTIRPGGPTSYATRPVAGGATAFRAFQNASGEKIIVPVIAAPFIGRQLDPSLFDVSALVRDGIGTRSSMPVALTFASGVTPTAPPGVRFTSVNGSAARGHLDAGSTTAFAAALRRRIGADVAAGRPAGSGELFGGLVSMTLDAPSTPFVAPRFDLHDLQLNAVDATGVPPDVADVVLLNTDDLSREQLIFPIVAGTARIAVPAGHYSANVLFSDFDAQGNTTALRVVTLDDFAVSATSPTTTATIDESSATSLISVATPRPAVRDLLAVDWLRQAAAGQTFDAGLFVLGTAPLYVTPQPVATVGRLRYLVQWGGVAAVAGDGYRYNLAFGADQVTANQAYTVRPADLAVVHQHFSADPAAGTHGSFLSGAVDASSPGVFSLFGGLSGQSMPGDLTQYLGAGDGGTWAQEVASPPSTPTTATLLADPHTFAARGDFSVDWAHGPLAPGFGQHTGPRQCLACTTGSTLSLIFDRTRDSVRDHGGRLFAGTQHLTLFQDGAQVFDGDGTSGAELTDIPTATAAYRAVYDTDLTGVAGFSQSTRTHTDLTAHQVPGANPLPSADTCLGQSPSAPCQVLPVLDLGYHLTSDENNTSGAATQTMGLTVGHLSYDGAGSHAAITGVTVAVSFDNGTTWQPAQVRGDNGSYAVAWTVPTGAGAPALRTTATDADGNTIAQTVWNAYTIAPTSGAADVCGPVPTGQARCFAKLRTDVQGVRVAAAPPAGYGPADLSSAYALPATGGTGQTVAVVDAGDDPEAEADLAIYRAHYGLPACTTANGCFRKVNQSGAAGPLPGEFGWGPEISLDLDMVSAVCPSCHILLVESNDPVMSNMAASEDTAVGLGATEVSNSFGATEQNGIAAVEPSFQHPGVAIVASSGDTGFGVPIFPAVATSVIAVGGTSLTRSAATSRGWTETAWADGGSGCSAWVGKPAWQSDPYCPGRTVADVAADADPATGVAVYDTHGGEPGWLVVGGTSAASPIIAGVIALAGNPARYPDASYLYTHTSQLNDVVGGSNVTTTDCGDDYLCTAGVGYDGPTGHGTPTGIGAF
jgi:hypothetical protein